MVGLIVISIAVPADLLDRADPGRLVPDMTLDPFILFLLPPLRSDAAILVMLAMVAGGVVSSVIPWLLRDRPPTVVEIDEAACTGCDLCVVDCPYLALRLEDDDAGRPVARLDPEACVACGICIGSCSFGAISMDGHPAPEAIDAAGHDVVLTCRRQGRHLTAADGDTVSVVVECTGALHPGIAGELTRLGATSVEIAGCGPGECAYGVGNQLTHERLDGTRRPHAARRDQGLAVETYVELGGVRTELPGTAPDPGASELPGSLRARTVGAGLAVLSLVVIGLATLVPFEGDGDGAALRVVAAHRIGDRIDGQPEPEGTTSGPILVEVAVDGRTETVDLGAGTRVDTVVDVSLEPGTRDISVTWIEGDLRAVLLDDRVDIGAGDRLLVPVADAPPPPGVREGREVFVEARAGSCTICHSTERGVDDVGPSLYGLADRAGTTVAGLDAEAYLRQSILDPDAYVVEGWPAGQMLPIYEDRLTPEQLDALIQYLLTLEAE